MKSLTILLTALLLSTAFFSGCLGSPKEQKAASDTTQPIDGDITPDEVVDLSDVNVSLIDENDTVEIGEMI